MKTLTETHNFFQTVEEKRRKVAIIGSCVSRDCFNSKFNPDWRKYFYCDVSAQQNSIISLVSDPISLDINLDNLSEWEKREVIYESKRQFWVDLEVYQPDIIIVDLFTEVRFPVIDLNGAYLTDNSWKLGKANGYEKLSSFQRVSLKENTEAYLDFFHKAIIILKEKLNDTCPGIKVLLNAPQAAHRYVDGDSTSYFDNEQVSEFNTFWGMVNQIFISVFNSDVITTPSSMIVGDAEHPWGKYFVHYNQSYYTHFLTNLLYRLGVKRRDRDVFYESGPLQINAFYNCKINSRKWSKGSLISNGRVVSIDAGVYQAGYLLNEAMLQRAHGYIQSGPFHLELKAESHLSSAIYGGFLVDHYGHFLLEGLSRLWALSKVDAPFLLQTPLGLNKISDLPKYMREIFDILGVSSRIKLIDRPISIETLYIPDSSNILDGLISDEYLKSVMGTPIENKSSKESLIYLSRSKLGSGVISDESHFEEVLRKNGFDIIHPEMLSVNQQIDIISNCKVLLGFVGSAFHTMVLCNSLPEKVVYLQRMNDLNANFKEIDHRLGVEALYVNAVISDDGLKGVGHVDFIKILDALTKEGIIECNS